MQFPKLEFEVLVSRLRHPDGKIHMVLDTDTYNEVDDQFALAYALRSPEKMVVDAVYAAPFHNTRSTGPADGMEKSYEEILRILDFMKIPHDNFVYKGSRGYLKDAQTPQDSDAAMDLVRRAKSMKDNELLYIVAIGAITNVASAILLDPEIINKTVVVWLGGNALNCDDNHEFNLMQDIHASRLIFDCGVPLIQIPCHGVTTHLHTTIPELEYYLSGKSELGTYLTDIVRSYAHDPYGWSKVIWDIATIAWLINPEWIPTRLVNSPVLTDQLTWSFDSRRHFIRSATFINRDPVFADLFRKLTKQA